MPSPDFWYVYLLRWCDATEADLAGQGSRLYYVGITNNLVKRLQDHNAGKQKATRGRQWSMEAWLQVPSQRHAAIVERWLKTGDSREKRLAMLALFKSGEQSGLFVDAFVSKAYNWYANRQKKGKV